jgi:UDP-3-O-[3-hydroxymyristoyl] N-acetylglucosamine deacetylase
MVFRCVDFCGGCASDLSKLAQIEIVSAHAQGTALFSGELSHVELAEHRGPTTLRTPQGGGPISEWSRVPAFRTTTIAHPSGARLACVEHLFAALAAFGAYEGVAISVTGNELPILDGASVAWCALLARLDPSASNPKLKIAHDGEVSLGATKYLFFADEMRSTISVELELDAGAFAQSLTRAARWDGSREDFAAHIATARTFIFARDLPEFETSGAGANISPESFVVIGEENAVAHGAPFSSDEPARHKLLDLIGDFFLYGGPPVGRVEVVSPGHAKNHEAIAVALSQGILARI